MVRLSPVEFDFWWPQRPEVNWQVLGLRGREQISAPYEFELELVCDDPLLDPEVLLGADCELLLDRNGLTRTVFGVADEVELTVASARDHELDGVGVRVRLVPAFRLLEHELDTRFFMGRTVIEILRDRLGPALAAWGRELDVESRITGHYHRRDYCVQFRESTFAFCSRLMEEEGIAYLFVPDHEGGRETMVLIDDNAGCGEVELLVPGKLPVVATVDLGGSEALDRESIQALDWRRRRTPNRVVARGYSLENPRRHDLGQAERHDRGRPIAAEQQLDGEQRQIIDDPIDDPEARRLANAELEQRGPMAVRRLQRHTVESAEIRGQANSIGFTAGGLFELLDPLLLDPSGATDGEPLLLVAVEHHGARDAELRYHNRFTCIRKSTPFRPARRTPRPRVHGVQTGVVVGRVGDEVYTDSLGRVRVRFHRDRDQDGDRYSDHGEHASCWIPVAQMWAGNGYGTMIIPRVGMEVVVSFVDGDPDRPLVTGSVYHADAAPPYPLPSEPSKSTIKTRSLGGDGFNELRIEDQDGREQIFVHAQRRMDLRVRGRLYESSFGGREQVIGAEDGASDYLAGSHNTLVHGVVNHRVARDRLTRIEHGDHRVVGFEVVEDLQLSHYSFVAQLSQLNASNVVVEASERISHKAGTIELAGSSMVSVKAGGTVVLQSNNRVELVVGQSFIVITPTGVEIGGPTIRLNSGGGAIGRATDGQSAIAAAIYDPVDALVADDGKPGGSGGGGGGRRLPGERTLEPRHAPPLEPMKPTKPTRPDADREPGERQIVQIQWVEDLAWCSEPVRLWVESRGYDGSLDETVIIDNQVDGVTQCVDVVRPSSPRHTLEVEITDLIPRRIGDAIEPERELLASLGQVKTPRPIRLRFIADLPRIRYRKGRARFDLAVVNHQVIIGGTIEYTRGWMHYIIRLDDLVPEHTDGQIGGKYYGSTDWRYCKRSVTDDGDERLVYWNGAAWAVVPKGWSSQLGTRLYGMAVWREGDEVKRQFGKLPWPDPVPESWTSEPDGDDDVALQVADWAYEIDTFWTGKLELQRNECRGHEHECCRHRVSCSVNFTEVDRKREGIILTQNYGRANASAWPYETDEITLAHEFGHHLGNPDEYEGATSVDPTVNDDGARAGIDEHSVMGSGELVRRRHFDTVCKAMAQSVAQHTSKQFSYQAVVPTRSPT